MSTVRLDRPSDPEDANFVRGGRNYIALERAGKAEAGAANMIARESAVEAVIAPRAAIARLRREQYGPSAVKFADDARISN